MEFIRYNNIEDFMRENFELILEKEWLNCLMVGNCLEGQKIGIEGWLLAKVQQNQTTELIILYRKPWKLIMYSPTNNLSDELYKFVAEEVYKVDSELLGVNAEKEIANKFAQFYCELSKQQYRLIKPLRILVLENLLPKENVKDAYNLVYTLSKKCLDEGAEYCVLYTDAENPISNHVYKKMGYVQRVECEELEFIKV